MSENLVLIVVLKRYCIKLNNCIFFNVFVFGLVFTTFSHINKAWYITMKE